MGEDDYSFMLSMSKGGLTKHTHAHIVHGLVKGQARKRVAYFLRLELSFKLL